MTPNEDDPAVGTRRHGQPMRLETRLGAIAGRSAGDGPALVFFAGALANGDLWRDVMLALTGWYRCITIDLPLGAHLRRDHDAVITRGHADRACRSGVAST
jgi:pimeloyl-ACP methyl ester carboxylesterase